jgi:hypothetical protein
MNEEYKALLAYAIVTFIVFFCALLWGKYRKFVKERFNIDDYRHANDRAGHMHSH